MTIAVARTDSGEGRSALIHAAREAQFQKTDLAVLHVIDSADPATDAEIDALRAEIGRTLQEAGIDGLDWRLHTAVEDGTTAETLVDLTAEVGAELLVLGGRRRTAIGKFLLGSTVQRVVLDSPVPVLVVKAPLS